MVDKEDGKRMKSRRAEGQFQENMRSGRRFGNSAGCGRHFGCSVFKGAFAMLLVLALVVSDALPVPGGMPDTVKADNYPRKGTITFYEYKAITNSS